MNIFQEADAVPTTQSVSDAGETQKRFADVLSSWNEIKTRDVKSLNDQLRAAGLPLMHFDN